MAEQIRPFKAAGGVPHQMMLTKESRQLHQVARLHPLPRNRTHRSSGRDQQPMD